MKVPQRQAQRAPAVRSISAQVRTTSDTTARSASGGAHGTRPSRLSARWAIIVTPSTPISGHPPTRLQWVRRRRPANAGFSSRPPSLPYHVRMISSAQEVLPIALATPSLVFSTTFPVKPSQTTISVVPLKISLPSTLPCTFNDVWRIRSRVFW